MKGLLKYLSPFAPDQSGAVSALFEFGGLTVVCDAGGCTGNICGFDEPRWFLHRSALFSACLRNMDAVMGRDDRLLERVAEAVSLLEMPFCSLIGTPVPAVTGMDFRALGHLVEKRTGVPCIAVPSTGARYYDRGASEAFQMLFGRFAEERRPVVAGKIGYLGATPLDLSMLSVPKSAPKGVYYGMGNGLDYVRAASEAEKNVVLSPSGLASAEVLKRQFGTPFVFDYPFLPKTVIEKGVKRVLVVHQQVAANAMRDKLRVREKIENVTVATWFMSLPQICEEDDFQLRSEEQFAEAAREYDCIVGDAVLCHALPAWHGQWVDFPHFAVSGRLLDAE